MSLTLTSSQCDDVEIFLGFRAPLKGVGCTINGRFQSKTKGLP